MTDEKEDSVVDGDAEPTRALVERYRQLLERVDFQVCADRQGEIEDLLWYGAAGSRERPIFEEELREIRRRGRTLRDRTGEVSPDLLILCVGYSPEPLLLAVAHHAPREIVLLIEENLRAEYLESFERLWNRYRQVLEVSELLQLDRRKVRDRAGEVFATVRKIAEGRGPGRIVVDITGAKKSMIAGAFLAAGFLDLETSYVDFGEYDNLLRRPVPGTSRPGRIEHPYRLFRLREEVRLHEELDRRHFREAERLAESLAEMAGSPEVAEVLGSHESRAQARRLAALSQVARGYALWSEGFYHEALAELTATASIPIPATVAALAPAWPRLEDNAGTIVKALAPQAVFADPARALAYFLDILVWNGEERIAETPRECYLRLYGTIESVVFFAFHVFVTRRPERLQVTPREAGGLDAFRARYPQERQGGALDWDGVLRAAAIEDGERNSNLALRILSGKSYEPKKKESPPAGKKLPPGAWKELPDCTVSLTAPAFPPERLDELFLENDSGVNLRTFSDLRNKAVHWLAPVPREFAVRLLKYGRSVLQKVIPQVVAHLREDGTDLDAAARDRLDEWEGRLLAAVSGSIPADCRPLTYPELRDVTRG